MNRNKCKRDEAEQFMKHHRAERGQVTKNLGKLLEFHKKDH